MVFTAIDINAIKVRIKKIVDAEILLVDTAKPKGKLREVKVGAPPNNNYKDLTHASLRITNSERWMEELHRGHAGITTILRVDLILTVHKEVSEAAEKEVDRFFQLLENQLYKFDQLDDPAAPGTDPLCHEFVLETTRRVPQFIGQEIDGFKTTMVIEIHPHDPA